MTAKIISLDNAKQEKLFYFVANVVIYREEDGRCLLLKRSSYDIANGNKWGTPGGKLEWGDLDLDSPSEDDGNILHYYDAIDSLLTRETLEESGLKIHEPFVYLTSKAIVRGDGVPFVLLMFAARYEGGDVVLEVGAFTDYKWVNETEVDDLECVTGIAEEVKQAISYFKHEKEIYQK